MSFPSTRETKLGRLLVKYCSDLLSDSRLDENQTDSVNIAMECLQQAFNIENIPTEKQDILNTVVGGESECSEEKKGEDDKMGTAFEDFLWKAKDGGFFKGCEPDTEKYHKRVERARLKYNERFPANQIDPLDKRPLKERKADAEEIKKEGNKKLVEKNYKEAIAEYTKAILLCPENAVYFSNRSAAYAYLKDYDEAIKDGNRAIQRRPDWPKGYMRVASAQDSLGDLKSAVSTYRECLTKIDAADQQWNNIHNSIESLERRLNVQQGGGNTANPLANMANMFGGAGGGGGMPGMPGGMDFGAMMKNPMMQQMAQQMMSDPNMMENMSKMMGNPEMQKMAADMMGGGGMGGGGGPMGGGSGLMELMSNREKMEEVLTKVYDDPETKEWMAQTPDAADILSRLRSGDASVGMELLGKPDIMAKMKSLLEKHM